MRTDPNYEYENYEYNDETMKTSKKYSFDVNFFTKNDILEKSSFWPTQSRQDDYEPCPKTVCNLFFNRKIKMNSNKSWKNQRVFSNSFLTIEKN